MRRLVESKSDPGDNQVHNGSEIADRRALADEFAAMVLKRLEDNYRQRGLAFNREDGPLTLCRVAIAAARLRVDPAVWFAKP